MPIITSIKPQKNKKRVNVYLDNKFGFGLDLETFVKLDLKVEQELTDEQVGKIVKEAEFQKVYDKLLRFSTLRPRSEKELKDWLKKHKVHLSIHENLYSRLKRLDLLNDNKFAQWWVEQRMEFSPRGKRALIAELRQKGINRDLIIQLVNESVSQGYEEKTARKLLQKKKYKWERLQKLEAKKKMSDFLARKGFGWEVIKNAIDDIFKKD